MAQRVRHKHLAVSIAKMKLKANGKRIELKCFEECHHTSHTFREKKKSYYFKTLTRLHTGCFIINTFVYFKTIRNTDFDYIIRKSFGKHFEKY